LPRIDFYILPDRTVNGRLFLACRLAEKAYGLGHTLYIHAESAEQARVLDDLLWTFRAGSFIPHDLCPVTGEAPPVVIGWGEDPDVAAEVLINLADKVPAFFERFARVAELVDQDPQTLAHCRQRFRFYRERGYTPGSHRL
jgi:DNA polymerase-3 subunit chi